MDIPLVHPSTYATSNTIWSSSSTSASLSYDNPFLPGERVIPSGRPGGYADIHSRQLQWIAATLKKMGGAEQPRQGHREMQQVSSRTGDIRMTQQYAGTDIAPALNFGHALPGIGGVSTQTQVSGQTGVEGRGGFGGQASWEMKDEKEPEANFDTLEYPSANISTGARYNQLLEAKLGPGTNPVVPYDQPPPTQSQTAETWNNNTFSTPIQYQSNWYDPTPNNTLYPTSGRSSSTSTSQGTSPIPPIPTSYHVHSGVLGESPSGISQQYHAQGASYFPYGPGPPSAPIYPARGEGESSRNRQQVTSQSSQPTYWSRYGNDSNRAGPSRQPYPGYPTWDQRPQVHQYPLPALGLASTSSGWLNNPSQSSQISPVPVPQQANYPAYLSHYQSYPPSQTDPDRPEPAPLQQPSLHIQPDWISPPPSVPTTTTGNSHQAQSQAQSHHPGESVAQSLPRSNVQPVAAHTEVPSQISGTPAIGQRKRRKTQSDEGRSGQLRTSISGTNASGMALDGSSASGSTIAQDAYLIQSGPSGSLSRARTVSEGRIRAVSSLRDQVQIQEGEGEGERKVVIACYHCRAKKLKCDGARPRCHHCSRRGEDGCFYDAQLRRRGPGKKTKEKMQHEAAVQAGRGEAGGVGQEPARGRDEVGIGTGSVKKE